MKKIKPFCYDGKMGLMNEKGKIILDCIYDWIEDVEPKETRRAKYGNVYYLFSYKGKQLSSQYYYYIGEVEEDGYRIVKNKKVGSIYYACNLIDKKGKLKYTNWHTLIGEYKHGKRILRS